MGAARGTPSTTICRCSRSSTDAAPGRQPVRVRHHPARLRVLGERHSASGSVTASSAGRWTSPGRSLSRPRRLPRTHSPATAAGAEALLAVAQRRGAWELIGNAVLRLRPPRTSARSSWATRSACAAARRTALRALARISGAGACSRRLRQLSQQSFPIEVAGRRDALHDLRACARRGRRHPLDDGLGRLRSAAPWPSATPPALQASEAAGARARPGGAGRADRKERAARENAELAARLRGCSPNRSWPRGRPSCGWRPRSLAAPKRMRWVAPRRSPRRTRATRTGTACGQAGNCPQEKGPADNHGCPRARKQIVILRETDRPARQGLLFAGQGPARSAIQAAPGPGRERPQVPPGAGAVQVEGHTDDRGGPR